MYVYEIEVMTDGCVLFEIDEPPSKDSSVQIDDSKLHVI